MSQGMPHDADRPSPEADISLGRELRRAREIRGFTIQQISQETKINERYLHALENDRLDLLPGQPYTSNFVRAVARTIGADEEELIDYLNYHLRTLQPARAPEARPGRERPKGLALVVGIGAVLIVVALGMALRPGGDDEDKTSGRGRDRGPRTASAAPAAPSAVTAPAVEPVPVEAAGDAATTPPARPVPAVLGTLATAPVPTAPSAPAPAPPTAPAAESAPAATAPAGPSAEEGPAPSVRLLFKKKGWIEAEQPGDAKPLLGIKDPGVELSWTLDRPLSLELSNAGGVEMYIDGQPAKPLGAQGETRRLTLDRRNWKSFLK